MPPPCRAADVSTTAEGRNRTSRVLVLRRRRWRTAGCYLVFHDRRTARAPGARQPYASCWRRRNASVALKQTRRSSRRGAACASAASTMRTCATTCRLATRWWFPPRRRCRPRPARARTSSKDCAASSPPGAGRDRSACATRAATCGRPRARAQSARALRSQSDALSSACARPADVAALSRQTHGRRGAAAVFDIWSRRNVVRFPGIDCGTVGVYSFCHSFRPQTEIAPGISLEPPWRESACNPSQVVAPCA